MSSPLCVVSCVTAAGDKRCGKSSLLSRFHDRVSLDASGNVSSSSSSSSFGSLSSLGGGSEYTVDYSFAAVKNARAVAAGEKDETHARMHIWQLDEHKHAGVIPCFLQANQQTHAAAASASSTAPTAATAATANPPATVLDYHTLDTAVFIVAFDLSEPWRAIETVRAWLDALQKVIGASLAALTAEQREKLKAKISKHVQSYHTASSIDAADSASPDPTAADAADVAPAPPVNPAVPAQNLGVPIILCGLKGDAFTRHLSSRTGADEKFEYLTRQLRKVALEFGAALIYTSAATMSTGRAASAAERKERGVNLDVLQQYIFHRLYRFPLAASSAADSPSGDSVSVGPKVVGSSEEEFGIYIPAGYDSTDLLDTTARNAVSAAYSDDTTAEEVFKVSAGRKRAAGQTAAGTAAPMFDTLHAEDNTLFFKQLKFQLEQGGGAPLSTAGLAALTNPLGSTSRAAPTQSKSALAGVAPAVSPSNTAALPAPSPTSGLTADAKSSAASAASTAAGSAAGAAGATPAKGQIAVKQFFKSLLSSTTRPDGNTKAAAAQVRRRERERERRGSGGFGSFAHLSCSHARSPVTCFCVLSCLTEGGSCERGEGAAPHDGRTRRWAVSWTTCDVPSGQPPTREDLHEQTTRDDVLYAYTHSSPFSGVLSSWCLPRFNPPCLARLTCLSCSRSARKDRARRFCVRRWSARGERKTDDLSGGCGPTLRARNCDNEKGENAQTAARPDHTRHTHTHTHQQRRDTRGDKQAPHTRHAFRSRPRLPRCRPRCRCRIVLLRERSAAAPARRAETSSDACSPARGGRTHSMAIRSSLLSAAAGACARVTMCAPLPLCRSSSAFSRRSLSFAARLLALCCALAILLGASTVAATNSSVATTTAAVSLRLLASDMSPSFLTNAALQYSLLRPEITINVVSVDPSDGEVGAQLAWDSLVAGEADAALLLFAPTDEQDAAQPDIVYEPFLAVAAVPVYNLPTISGDLILTADAVARIYLGNITMYVCKTGWQRSSVALHTARIVPSPHSCRVCLCRQVG